MRVIACQIDSAWEDKPTSHARVSALLGGTEVTPGSLIALPEMFATGFSLDVAKIDEGEARPSERFLSELAKRHRSLVIGGVVARAADGFGRNLAAVLGPDGALVDRYAKLHPFSFGGETKAYRGGDRIVVLDWQGWKVAPLICYDLRFPEAFRLAARRGAELFVVIASFPTPRLGAWLTLLAARAIENQAYVLGVNRCGRDPGNDYPGRSLVIDPWGKVLGDAGAGPAVLEAELDRQALLDYRQSFPALRDARRDLPAE